MKLELLRFLERLRFPALNTGMQALTELGSEALFLVAALALFWCVNKKEGYYLLTVGFFGTVLNQFLKLLCRVPRPWVRDPNFTIVESARAGATGYSFPSGHTQNAVGTFGVLARCAQRRGLRSLYIALAVLVPFSRMYLGVHTPADVLVAAGIAMAVLFLVRPLVYSKNPRVFPALLGVMGACALGFVAYVEWAGFPADMDSGNLTEGVKNAYSLLGAFLGMLLVYFVDEKKLHFTVQAVWWAQLLKLLIGLTLVMVLRLALKQPLLALTNGHALAHGLRYFILVVFAGAVWPLSFRWFQRLGREEEDKI